MLHKQRSFVFFKNISFLPRLRPHVYAGNRAGKRSRDKKEKVKREKVLIARCGYSCAALKRNATSSHTNPVTLRLRNAHKTGDTRMRAVTFPFLYFTQHPRSFIGEYSRRMPFRGPPCLPISQLYDRHYFLGGWRKADRWIIHHSPAGCALAPDINHCERVQPSFFTSPRGVRKLVIVRGRKRKKGDGGTAAAATRRYERTLT